jgi:hypothetical protein
MADATRASHPRPVRGRSRRTTWPWPVRVALRPSSVRPRIPAATSRPTQASIHPISGPNADGSVPPARSLDTPDMGEAGCPSLPRASPARSGAPRLRGASSGACAVEGAAPGARPGRRWRSGPGTGSASGGWWGSGSAIGACAGAPVGARSPTGAPVGARSPAGRPLDAGWPAGAERGARPGRARGARPGTRRGAGSPTGTRCGARSPAGAPRGARRPAGTRCGARSTTGDGAGDAGVGTGAGVGSGASGGGGAERGGRRSSGFRYAWRVPASRTPKCRWGSAAERDPVVPTAPSVSPVETCCPARTEILERWRYEVSKRPSPVRTLTVRPDEPAVPANRTSPPLAAATRSPTGPAMSMPRCWPPA